ncbi:MAG: flagellar basal body rod C-terminal domain-containing protein, partial [Candidatus Kapaibacterium sp.]
FANKINNALLSGYGLNDNDLSAPPNGRLFFYPQDTSNLNAGNISINPFFLTNPSELPLSSLPAEPGNTDIARLVASLVDDKTFSNNLDYKNLTPIEYYSLFVSKVGNYARESLNGLENSKLAESQLSNMRESIMGVNLDEEAVNLIKYQKGFEAASRIINVTNELLGTLINLGK